MKRASLIAFFSGCRAFTLRGTHEFSVSGRQSALESVLHGDRGHTFQHAVDKGVRDFHDFGSLHLPRAIESMITTRGDVQLDEASIHKARKILNGMMESAQNELDEKTMECKEFKERNRQTWNQVDTDLKRLSQQISDLEGAKQEASAEITAATEFINEVEEQRAKETKVYDAIRQTDDDEMVWRKSDLRVAEFLLKLTMCPKKGAMLIETPTVERCEHETNGKKHHTARFAFARRKHKLAMLSMSNEGKAAVERALVAASQPASTAAADQLAKKKPDTASQGSSKPASKRKQAKKCTLGKPNCGLLHDNMSLMWGQMKDAVDTLDAKMRKEAQAWNLEKENWNEQISLATGNKETAQAHLAEAIAEQTADMAEQDKKEQEERRLQKEFEKGWGKCVAEMNEILFTKFCGVKAARGELHKKSAEVKPDEILDCEVTDWVAQDCSVECDDELKGGTQLMTREIVQQNNTNGVKCPAMSWVKKCNQMPCPIDCDMSHWSEWSTCTAECGGGVKARSRYVETRPKNGGVFCDVPNEVSSCNTGSCDRNCRLTRWKIRPCSVACGGGYTVRKKHVRRRARGKGKCPSRKSRRRYGKRRCNRHQCYGDEECLAKQDVVLAVDGSGSVKKKGFNVLRKFAMELATKFRPESEDYVMNDETKEWELKNVTAAQLGVIQFGQGVLKENNTVGGADIVKGIDNDVEKTGTALKNLKWERGFTNMAQAFMAAETLFLNGGRQHAQSVVICISDGKPSFLFQTDNAVRKLRRKGVKVIMVVVKEFLKTDEKKQLRKWASVPRGTNFLHIPGLKVLNNDMAHWVNKVLIHSCPKTISLMKEQEEQQRLEQQQAMEELASFTAAA